MVDFITIIVPHGLTDVGRIGVGKSHRRLRLHCFCEEIKLFHFKFVKVDLALTHPLAHPLRQCIGNIGVEGLRLSRPGQLQSLVDDNYRCSTTGIVEELKLEASTA